MTVLGTASSAPLRQEYNVSYCRNEYNLWLPRWHKVRAACEGEETVKALPGILPYLNELDKSDTNKIRNHQYLNRAVYFNATGRTLEGLIGLAFARDPDVNLGKFKYLADNADGGGVSIYHCAQQALAGVLQTSRYGILTDFTNGAPSIVGYDASSIINWRVNAIAGIRRLVLLVLREVITDESGDFECSLVEQFREYRLIGDEVFIKVWRRALGSGINTSSELQVYASPKLLRPDRSSPAFKEIPFCFIGAKSNSAEITSAPLRGLAEMNLAHFRDSADYQDSVFFCGQVQPWITGLSEDWRDWLQDKGLYVGSRAPILLPTGAQFGFAQAQPNTLAKEAMASKQEMMIALGARVVEENKVSKTATQAQGDIATGTSVLGLCCGNVSEAMTRALQWCGEFDNAKPFADAKFALPTDFSATQLSSQDLQALVAAWQSGAFARSDLRVVLKKGGIIAPERTDAEIDGELEGEMDMPVFTATGGSPATGGPPIVPAKTGGPA